MKKEDLQILAKAIHLAMDVFQIDNLDQLKQGTPNYKGNPFAVSRSTIDRIIKASKGHTVSLRQEIAAEVAERCGLDAIKNGLGYDVSLPYGMTWDQLRLWQKENMSIRTQETSER